MIVSLMNVAGSARAWTALRGSVALAGADYSRAATDTATRIDASETCF